MNRKFHVTVQTYHSCSMVSIRQCLAAEELEPVLQSFSACSANISHFLLASLVTHSMADVCSSKNALFPRAASPREFNLTPT